MDKEKLPHKKRLLHQTLKLVKYTLQDLNVAFLYLNNFLLLYIFTVLILTYIMVKYMRIQL